MGAQPCELGMVGLRFLLPPVNTTHSPNAIWSWFHVHIQSTHIQWFSNIPKALEEKSNYDREKYGKCEWIAILQVN